MSALFNGHKLIVCLFLFLLIDCTLSCAQREDSAPPLQVWTATGLEKVRIETSPTKTTKISLKAARNEFELAHIVVRANGNDLAGVDVQVSDLVGEFGSIPLRNIHIYREDFLRIEKRSNVDGDKGSWPDPLIPKEDLFYHEKRNAFPFGIKNSHNQPILYEVYVPVDTSAGIYRGTVRVTAQGQVDVVVPVELEVFNFALPSTSSLKTSYSASLLSVSKGFTQGKGYKETGIFSLVMKQLLLHRISTRVATVQNHAPYKIGSDGMVVDWRGWDQIYSPFFDGSALDSMNVLPGARFTTWNLLVDTVPAADQILYAGAQTDHFREKGWGQFLYRKCFDEPEKVQYPLVHAELSRWKALQTPVALLVTTGDVREFAGEVTLWCDVINFLHRYDDRSKRGKRDTVYAERLQKGDRLWWYQSCSSTGCGTDGTAPLYAGWPSVAIDHPGIYQRIMPWITWKYDIEGELYYDVAANWNAWDGKEGSRNDPWSNFDYFRLNGDGRLIYPGTVDKIGGKRPIPIDSLRLKLIRDGYEDYEYFVLMKKMGFEERLTAMIGQLVKRDNDWQKNPALLLELRNEMGALMSKGQAR